MSGHKGKTRKREQVILALLACPTIREASKQSGVSEPTIQRWLRENEFIDEYRRAKDELIASATAQLRNRAGRAVNTLEDVANDSEAASGARVSAARAIIELALKSHETEVLENRIAKLENQNDNQ